MAGTQRKQSQGRQVYQNEEGYDPKLKPCDFFKKPDGSWIGMTPNGIEVDLTRFSVKEFGNGSVSVYPSISAFAGEDSWVGIVRGGVWIS